MNAVLGIDTSCYTTSVALVDLEGNILSSQRKLLCVPEGERGLMQSHAVFDHIKNLPELTSMLFAACKDVTVCAVCASTTPRSTTKESYMPVFRVGESQARVLASSLRVPFYATSHQDGHVRAALVDSGMDEKQDYIALHLSGGTTEVLAVRGKQVSVLGGSSDLHAGQFVDRIGVKLGLGFPAGPALEKLALTGIAQNRLGVSIKGCYCQLSGAETKLSGLIDKGLISKEDAAAEVYAFLCRSILAMIEGCMQETGMSRALLAGGVSSSLYLRELLNTRVRKRRSKATLHFARPELSGDNAVGVALLGAESHHQNTYFEEK